MASLAALSFGISNFAGGRASRGASPVRVAASGHLIGLASVALAAWVWGSESVTRADLLWGGAAGAVSAAGVLALYMALRDGGMGIVIPVTAGVASAIPALWGLVTGDVGGVVTLAGLALVFSAVLLVSVPDRSGQTTHTPPRATALAMFAGGMFASSFFFLAQTGAASGLWPTVSLRIVSAALLVAGALAWTRGVLPPRAVALDTVVAGVLEILATIFVLFAVQLGPVAVAAVVIGLYPGVTAGLARVFLGERLAYHQYAGIVLALVGIALLSV
jgi:drug/metabolite transporter (DMT)-like permease